MQVHATSLPGVLLIEPRVFEDSRGYLYENFQAERYREAGVPGPFVQDNHSRSARGVLRGLHFQRKRPQGKLICVSHGGIFDVAVDVRPNSETFGRWFGVELSAASPRQLYVPAGFAHGFCVLSDSADVIYKCTEYYDPADEGGVLWNDPELAIDWPIKAPLLSAKDAQLPPLRALAERAP